MDFFCYFFHEYVKSVNYLGHLSSLASLATEIKCLHIVTTAFAPLVAYFDTGSLQSRRDVHPVISLDDCACSAYASCV